jgi:cytoskeletal protein RodZ
LLLSVSATLSYDFGLTEELTQHSAVGIIGAVALLWAVQRFRTRRRTRIRNSSAEVDEAAHAVSEKVAQPASTEEEEEAKAPNEEELGLPVLPTYVESNIEAPVLMPVPIFSPDVSS